MPYFGRGDFFVAKQGGNTRQASFAVGKLRKGYALADANREAAAIGASAPGLPAIASGPLSLMDVSRITGANARRVVLILFAAVGFVLLIACANVANLLLARTWSRQREFAVRGAMGAGRGRLARQLFTECVVLAVLGGLAGFAVALMIDRVIVLHHPDSVRFEGRMDGLVFGWTMLVAIVTGLLFGVAPAALIGDGRLSEMLKSSARASTGSAAARRLRSTLVVVEVALSVVLLVGSGLLARSIIAMQQADIGIEPDGLASIVVRQPGRGFDESPDARAARLAVTARVQRIPGVEAAAIAYSPPPDYAVSLRGVDVEGSMASVDSLGPIQFNRGTQDFFRVTGLRFVEGRPYSFDAGPNEMVVNERFAHRFWPGGAIGHRVKFDSTWSTIVGVVANTSVPGEKGQGSGLQLYMPMVVAPLRTALIVRSRLPAPALEAALRAAIKEAAPRANVSDFELATARLADARETHRFTLGMVGAFAGLALLLAAIGLGAVISYSVSQRMREMGIRIALGAQSSQVARLVLGQGVLLAIIGIVAGSAAGLAATRLMRSMLYGVSPGDPLTTAAVAVLLLVVAAAACALPARRATRVDPVEMVRAE
jgi:predicted permease